MSALPIRVRLTGAFALAMMSVLVAAGLFVGLRLAADLDESLDAGLRARADAVMAVVRASGPRAVEGGSGGGVGEPDEAFAQVLSPQGRVVGAAGGARAPALTVGALRGLSSRSAAFEREIEGIEGTARVLARPLSNRAGSGAVAVGQSLEDRDEVLTGLLATFALGGPVAVVLASILGYALAAAGLAPVEAMRRRAAEVSLSRGDEKLPLPPARDEIRRLGETLNEMLERLSRSFERERRFVADASHELRTPVAVVKAELEAALRSGDLGPGAREAVVAAAEECDRLAQLAEDLLVVARSGDGRLPVRPERLRARAALEDVRARFADRATERGRTIEVASAGDPIVSVDPLRLRQALGNLVDNALRHGAGEIVLEARVAGGGVAIDVTDAGAGFDSQASEWAFQRFSRGDEARSRSGAGLGLAIVRAIAEAHGGRAEIVPEPAAGVRIWLPGGAPELEDDARPESSVPGG